MSLPASWVDRIFQKLTLTYGRDFAARWEGLDVSEVKADWAEALGGYEQHPEAIAFALTILDPAKPPTVLQFAELCRRAPVKAPLALESPAPNPEVATMALNALKRAGVKQVGDKSWAYRLRDREIQGKGKGLTSFQRHAWREALGVAPGVAAQDVEGQA